MTRLELEGQLDRFAHAGYRMPEDMAGLFGEWFAALERYDAGRVEAAVTRLIRTRASSFWPTLADVLEAVRVEGAGRDAEPRGCPTCHGTAWIEAPPYRANGGLVYQGVRRCPDCGVPAPRQDGPSRQTPLSAVELREWAQSRRPVEMLTHADMMTAIRALCARKGMR